MHSASKTHITLAVTILIAMLWPIAKGALMARIVILPRLASILEHNWIEVATLCFDLNGPWQMARNAESLALCINRGTLHLSNDLARGVVDDDVESVIRTNAIFIALVLYDVHRAPSRCESRRRVDGLEDTQTKSCGANYWDTALPADGTGADDVPLFAQVAVVALGVIDHVLYIHRLPVVEVGEL